MRNPSTEEQRNYNFLAQLEKLPTGAFKGFALKQLYSNEFGDSRYVTKTDFLRDFLVHFYNDSMSLTQKPEVVFVRDRYCTDTISVFATKRLAHKYLTTCHSKELQAQLEICDYEVSARTLMQSEIIRHICDTIARLSYSSGNKNLIDELVHSNKLQDMAHSIYEYGITELKNVSINKHDIPNIGFRVLFTLAGTASESGNYKGSTLTAGDLIHLDYTVGISADCLRDITLAGMEFSHKGNMQKYLPSVPYVLSSYLSDQAF